MKSLRFVSRFFLVLLWMGGLSASAMAEFDEGIDYKTVPTEGLRDGEGIEVLEFFYYGCPHCDRLRPSLEEWKRSLPDDVRFERVPAAFNPRWTLYARAYYAAEALGVLDKGHGPLFDALHRENKKFSTRDDLADFWVRYGADREKFLALMDDFNLDRTKVRRAAALGYRYGLEGVPSLVIDGRWRTSPSIAGGSANALQVADYLIEKARKMR